MNNHFFGRFFRVMLLMALLGPACRSIAEAKSFSLSDSGTEKIIDFEKYGEFQGLKTPNFHYTIRDKKGLAAAMGLGIEPNFSVYGDSRYQKLKDKGLIKPSAWQHVNSGDPEADFYAWATAQDDAGVKLLFTAKALEAGGQYLQAIKAYQAALILHPHSYCWAKDKSFTWLVAPAALDGIINLTRTHPELKLKLEDAFLWTESMVNGDPTNNVVSLSPGRLVSVDSKRSPPPVDLSQLPIVGRRGGHVSFVRYENGHWGLRVNGEPFIVQGVTYLPTKIGKEEASYDWMNADDNHNRLIDAPQEAWVDKNRNGIQDPDEPGEGDFSLMQKMGTNAIRIFNNHPLNLPLLREMYEKYGIRGIVCEPLGAYTVHAGIDWKTGTTDYRDPDQRKHMLDAVADLANEVKDEPWMLMYVLGNENNMASAYRGVNSTRTNAAVYPDDYARFLNEAASLLHKLDPNHPVGVGNLETGFVDRYARLAPELDFIGVNSYRGKDGFGSLWLQVKSVIDRPILITEYGCDAYWTGRGPDEQAQADYLQNSWKDIEYNSAGEPGEGNSIGGIVFEWLDEWWKDNNPGEAWETHSIKASTVMPFPDGYANEEWFGLAGQGEGKNSPFLRELRKSYFMFQKMWTKEK